MASGIEAPSSAVPRSVSVPSPVVRREPPSTQGKPHPGGDLKTAGPLAPNKDRGSIQWEEVARASKEAIASLLEYAQQATLASNTTVYYQRDQQTGRMYMHVVDKKTGELLYRIPKDYLAALDTSADESHRVDLQI